MAQRLPPLARSVYATLMVATLVGAAAAVVLIWFFPPTDLEAAHAKATTPFARAVTSHAVDVTSAVLTCITVAWLLALAGMALAWRKLARTHDDRRSLLEAGREVFIIFLLLMWGSRSLDHVPRLAEGGARGVMAWIALLLGAAAGMLGLALFLQRLVTLLRRSL